MVLSIEREEAAPETTLDIECRIAATRAEREAAFHLVYRSYLQGGLGEMNPFEMRVTPYHLLPTTEVFIALHRDEVILTTTLVSDGDLGLPLEAVYAEEVAHRRQRGMRLAEVSCLADRRSSLRGFFPVFLRLTRLMAQYARRQQTDAFLLAVHPRHSRFYRRYMDFRTIAEERAYPTVRNRPAVALELDFNRIDLERPDCYDLYFAESLPAERLQPCPMTRFDVEYFAPMIDPAFKLAPLGFGEEAPAAAAIHAA